MRKHLAIMRKSAIEAILFGQKNIETRFSQRRIPPFGVIGRGDLVYMKPPGAEVIGQFRVKKVYSYEGLTPQDFEEIFAQFDEEIKVGVKEEDESYFKDKRTSSFGTLIFIADSERFITSPIKVSKKDLRGWVVLP